MQDGQADSVSSGGFEFVLAMDPDSGMVDVNLLQGEVMRPLRCEEIAFDDEQLAVWLSRHVTVDTPEGPTLFSPDDWMSGAVESSGIRDRVDARHDRPH